MTENRIKIGQMADLHLGYRQYGKYDRIEDFFGAAMTAAEILVTNNVDITVVAGDIFHKPRPYPVDQRHAIKVFRLFKDAEIPVFAVRGNHDASYAWSKRQGGNEIHVLQDLGLVTLLEDEFQEVKLNNELSVRVWGLGYRGRQVISELDKLVEDNKDMFEDDIPNILVLHEYLENLVPSAELSEYSLDLLGFDYIALGHYHGWWKNSNSSMCSTGSTEHVSAAEWDTPKRSVAVVSLEAQSGNWKPSVQRLEFSVRPKLRIKLELGAVTLDEASNEVIQTLRELDKKDIIIRIDVEGVLTDTQQTLNVSDLTAKAEQAFHVKIVPNMEYEGLPISEDVTDSEVMEEVFAEKFGISEERTSEWVRLAQDMKTILVEPSDDRGDDTLLEMLYDFVETVSETELEEG